MIDVDYFKRYNDHFGHPAGDACLQKLAQLLKKHTSRSGDIAARYGGEEFLLVLPNFTMEEVMPYISRLQQAVAELHIPHPLSPVKPYITLSAGITVGVPNHINGMEEFIKEADIALYQAKKQGRDDYVVYECTKTGVTHVQPVVVPVKAVKKIGNIRQ